VVLDHAPTPAEKIRISGGGRCNFTNLATGPDRFLSDNPRFAASALARYRPQAFVDLVDRAGIAWHEKTQGQLFCDGKATQITDMLLDRMAGADLRLGTRIDGVSHDGDRFVVATAGGPISTGRVVVATGGKSIPNRIWRCAVRWPGCRSRRGSRMARAAFATRCCSRIAG
jgi:predicted flavoprotein YhiN